VVGEGGIWAGPARPDTPNFTLNFVTSMRVEFRSSFSLACLNASRANCLQQGRVVALILVGVGDAKLGLRIFESSVLAHVAG
jgi:hypothetical protein